MTQIFRLIIVIPLLLITFVEYETMKHEISPSILHLAMPGIDVDALRM